MTSLVPIPREHGAWAVLLVPILVVAAVLRTVNFNLLFLTVSLLLAFMAFVPAQILLRRGWSAPANAELKRAKTWSLVYAVGCMLFALPLVLQGFWSLPLFGLIGVAAFIVSLMISKGSQKTILSDLFAVLGLTLSGPAAYYVLRGSTDALSAQLWLLCFLFFGSSVFYVHMKLKAASLKGVELDRTHKLSLGWLNLGYHFLMLALVGVLAALNFTNELAVVAFAPIAVHAVYGTFKLSTRVKFKNLGWALLGHSIAFVILLVIALANS